MAVTSPPDLVETKTNTSNPHTTIVSDSFEPSADHILKMGVATDGVSAEPGYTITNTFSPALSWTSIPGGTIYAAGNRALDVYWANTGSTPGPGTVTATFDTDCNNSVMMISETDGHDTSTPISEVDDATGGGSTLSITLADFTAGNLNIGIIADWGDRDIAAGTGETELSEVNTGGSSTTRMQIQYGVDTTVNWSNLDNRRQIGCAFELAAAAAGVDDDGVEYWAHEVPTVFQPVKVLAY